MSESKRQNFEPQEVRTSIVAKKTAPQKVHLPIANVTVEVLPRLGKHSQQASILMDGDEGKYFSALMHLLVQHKGQKFPMEDFEEMAGEDYDALLPYVMGNSKSQSKI